MKKTNLLLLAAAAFSVQACAPQEERSDPRTEEQPSDPLPDRTEKFDLADEATYVPVKGVGTERPIWIFGKRYVHRLSNGNLAVVDTEANTIELFCPTDVEGTYTLCGRLP